MFLLFLKLILSGIFVYYRFTVAKDHIRRANLALIIVDTNHIAIFIIPSWIYKPQYANILHFLKPYKYAIQFSYEVHQQRHKHIFHRAT